MNPRWRAVIQIGLLLLVVVSLVLVFPSAFGFAEMAGRELRYFWWLVLIVALAVWLIIGLGRKPKP
jgi:hypothetical protein